MSPWHEEQNTNVPLGPVTTVPEIYVYETKDLSIPTNSIYIPTSMFKAQISMLTKQ